MATGRPTPSIFWGKEGVFSVLFPGMSVANVHVTGDGCLKIREPDLENSGRYTCNVVNDVGAAMSTSHVLVSDNSSRPNIYQVSWERTNSAALLDSKSDTQDTTSLILSDTLRVRDDEIQFELCWSSVLGSQLSKLNCFTSHVCWSQARAKFYKQEQHGEISGLSYQSSNLVGPFCWKGI